MTSNEHVKNGITLASVKWAFTHGHAYNWHPMTWISHMIDVSLYGLDARGHHLTSILLHTFNSILLLTALFLITKSVFKSGMISILFAFHPLHVESVAWIAERKDLLCGMFFMLCLITYHYYKIKPGLKKFFLLLIFFISGLMSKPMLVTLPFVLMLLDFWPLKKFSLKDKIPLIILSAASCIITIIVQSRGEVPGTFAVRTLQEFPLWVRIANAFTAYTHYLLKTIWPMNLCAIYPHQGDDISLITAVLSFAVMTGLSLLAVFYAKKIPYFFTGWFWYTGMLFPVIGIIQAGSQGMADRYTYLPLTGIFICLSWGAGAVIKKNSGIQFLLFAAIISSLVFLSHNQAGYWKNSKTLFEHAIRTIPLNYLAEHELGKGLAVDFTNNKSDRKLLSEALEHLKKAVEYKPGWALARLDYSFALCWNRQYAEAEKQIDEVKKLGHSVPRDYEKFLLKKIMDSSDNRNN